ncbi:non-lysosomal glucosylceramidase [Pyrus ussuriensis x Pyrus communis]|uniref:Non-lysosomal glucosylceramidase n=1 Tax=Pyrus ussuriensis x Pyrus communis TaxID=2448454 RepID=A0A5N5FQE3_9ROSA|nr:non-lysosomal glucosylceramidase [Pyrus ussuriensis x Pyrus communis]
MPHHYAFNTPRLTTARPMNSSCDWSKSTRTPSLWRVLNSRASIRQVPSTNREWIWANARPRQGGGILCHGFYSFDNCLDNLTLILKRCVETNLVLNWEKCHFMVKQGIVLGHIRGTFVSWPCRIFISREGVNKKYASVLAPGHHEGLGKADDQGISSWGWNLGGQHSTYHALFPRAWTIYDGEPDPEVKISCRQISPFIPHNYRESSLPTAVFVYTLVNTGKERAKVNLLFTWANSIGGISHLSGNHVNEPFIGEDGVSGVLLHHKTAKGNPPVTFAIAACETQNVSVSVLPCFGLSEGSATMAKEMWDKMVQDGEFHRDNFNSGPCMSSSPGETICAAVAASAWVEPHGKCTVAFGLSWSSPKVKFLKGSSYHRRYTKFYGTSERAAQDMVHDALTNYKRWEEDIERWQNPILRDETLPECNHSAVVEHTATGCQRSVKLDPQNANEEVGRFLYLEGVEYIMWNTYDVHFYASFALLELFPKIELNIQRDFAKAVLSEDGRKVKFLAEGNWGIRKVRGAVPHDLGTHDPWNEMNAYNIHDTSKWKDLNPKFVLQVYRDFSASGDMSFGVDVWPAVRAAMEYMEQFDRDNDGLIENDGFPDQTYDAWTVHGVSAYCGCLWLAALQAAAAMAFQLGDKEFAEWCKTKFLKAKPSFEEKLWNGSYFSYDSGSSSNSKSIQADQLAGQWYTASSGLPSLFDDFKIESSLQKIYDFNVMKVKGGRMGAVNGMHPSGKVDESCMQSREIWTGVTYGVAATMILAGKEKEAFTTAEGIFIAGWSEEGFGNIISNFVIFLMVIFCCHILALTPEGWTMDGHFRSLIYMRPLSIWGMQFALNLPKAILEAPQINIMDRIHLSSVSSQSSHNETGVRKIATKAKCFGNSVFNCAC